MAWNIIYYIAILRKITISPLGARFWPKRTFIDGQSLLSENLKINLIAMVRNILKRKMKEEYEDGTKSEISLPKRVMESTNDSSEQTRCVQSAPSSIAGHCMSPYHSGMEDISPPSRDHSNLAQYFQSFPSFGLFPPGIGTLPPILPTASGWFSYFKRLISKFSKDSFLHELK